MQKLKTRTYFKVTRVVFSSRPPRIFLDKLIFSFDKSCFSSKKMPHLRIETNVARDKVPADLAKSLCQVIATSLGKPLNYCCVTIVPDSLQSWGGTGEPSAQAVLMSIGQLGIYENQKHSKVIFEAVVKGLGIDPSKMYIHFQDAKSQEVGYKGTTFYEIFGG